MALLLQHLAEMTSHRDHHLLDISVVSALHQLTGLDDIRLFEIFQLHDEWCLRRKVWLDAGVAVSSEDDGMAEQSTEPLTRYKALAACIARQESSVEENLAGNVRLLWLPIWINDKAIGCLAIETERALAQDMQALIEGTLKVYRNFQNLLDYSERDSLTGLLNRKTFDEKFSRMTFPASGYSHFKENNAGERRKNADAKEHWLAVIDIDHFKKVNDEYGHLYGDEVLILVANILKSSFRAYDRIFRFGGEEFVILLRSATLSDAQKVLERFRKEVEVYPFPQVGRVTVSIGFVGITSNLPVVILGQADRALYHAKTHGRNQVCYHDELVSRGLLQPEAANSTVEFF